MRSEIPCERGFDDFLALERRAEERPEATALAAPQRAPLSYGGMAEFLHSARSALCQAEFRPGQVCALALPTGPEAITAFLAISGIGACAPLDPTLTEDEYRYYLARLGAQMILIQDGTAAPAASAARSLGMRVLKIEPTADAAAGVFSLAPSEDLAPLPVGRTTDAALLLHTSATTGIPKLVPLTWTNLLAMSVRERHTLELSETDRFLSLMPLFHMAGLGSVLTQLYCGGMVISTPGFSPATFLKRFEEFRPTWFKSNPPLNRVILGLAREHPQIFHNSSLRFILGSGAAPDPGLPVLLEEALGAPVLNGYGLTETGGVARTTPAARKPGSAGRSSGLDVAILDPQGNPMPVDAEGEIVVRGPSVTAGYLDNPEANEAAFRGGWFHTGDLGRLDGDGCLFITGRIKEMINRGGEKILPREVDEVLLAHAALADAAAFAVPHPTLGEDIAAAVVLRAGAATSEQELRQFAGTRLASFKVPRRIVFVEKIPRTATGKPQRGVLADMLGHLTAATGDVISRPPGIIEARLMEIWRRVLGVDQIGVDDDFFTLGGDSLAVAVMLSDVEKSLRDGGEELECAEFFDHPTIATLARILGESSERTEADSESASPGDARMLVLRRNGSNTPIFCFPASALDPYYFRSVAKSLGDEQPFYVVRHAAPVRDGRLLPLEELARISVAAIQRARPRGPYILGGHCFGGVIAFEAAQQLIAQGEQVETLVLFDAPAPGHPKIHTGLKRYFLQAQDLLAALARGERPITTESLLKQVCGLGHILTRRFTGRASRALTAVGSDVMLVNREPKELQGMVMWEYAPRDFQAPIVHIFAADEPVSTKLLKDPRLGWSRVARAGLQERALRGNHNSLFLEANAGALAAELTNLVVLPSQKREAGACK
jgi:acyl-CoA synthetase (AMP-forming)/AMP-acid ligase II/thioesterase domain-containing protein